MAWFDALKESAVLPLKLSGLFSSVGESPPKNQKDFIQLYEKDPWVKRAIDIKAQFFGTVKMEVLDEEGNSVEHPILDLFQQPNEDQSQFDFFRESLSFLDLGGESMWEVQTSKGRDIIPRRLYNIKPYRVTIMPNESLTAIDHFKYEVSNSEITFNLDEIAFVRNFHPTDDFRGLPSLKPLAHIVNADKNGWEWINSFLKGKGKLEGFLSTEARVSPNDSKRLKKQWKQIADTDGVPLLPKSITYEAIARPPKESGLIDIQNFITMTKISCLGVYPALAGVTESAHYASFDEQLQAFFSLTMVPEFKKFEGLINRKLMPRYGTKRKGQTFRFCSESVDLLSFETLVEILGKQFDAAALTPNEFIEQTGIGLPYDLGDAHYVGERKERASIEQDGDEVGEDGNDSGSSFE
jgi:HK97 family phage portal protein